MSSYNLKRLEELRNWLGYFNYLENVTDKAFHYSALQEPTPFKCNIRNIPFINTYHSNVNNKILVKNIQNKVNNIYSDYLKEVFNDTISVGLKATKNIFLIINK